MPNCTALIYGLSISSLLIAPVLSATTLDCEVIAAETISELKAGAADWWTEDTAKMAGMAAASACFKTLANMGVSGDDAATPRETGQSAEDRTEFMGLEVRPLSGPPSRKPYERNRE